MFLIITNNYFIIFIIISDRVHQYTQRNIFTFS